MMPLHFLSSPLSFHFSDIMFPLAATALGKGWVTVAFARGDDLKTGALGARMKAVRPTVFLGVPRVWEKISEMVHVQSISNRSAVLLLIWLCLFISQIKRKVAAHPLGGVKKKLVEWAKGVGARYQANCQMGGTGQKPFGYSIANAKVLAVAKKALGLDAIRLTKRDTFFSSCWSL